MKEQGDLFGGPPVSIGGKPMIKLKPFMSKGSVFCIGGKLSLEPVHLFRLASGGSILRIGSTTLWFTEEGEFDGPETKLSGLLVPAFGTVCDTMEVANENKGLPPEDPYFEKGTPGFDSEVASAVSLLEEALAKIPPEKQKPFREALASVLASSEKN